MFFPGVGEGAVFDLMGDKTNKKDLWEISERLHGLAREVKSLSQNQPDFRSRIQIIQQELRSIGCSLRGTD